MEDEKMDWVHIDIKLSISRDDTDRYIDIIRKDTFRIPTPDSSFEFIHREYSSRIYRKDNEKDEELFKRALLIFIIMSKISPEESTQGQKSGD